MDAIALASLAFATALICAVLMGYAIQRGATCMVAAIDEVVSRRTAKRLVALAEAALWVAGGLVVAQFLGGIRMTPTGHAVGWGTVLGGLLLGLGALINRACVFGAIARLGSGEWAYAITPVGFFIGCVGASWLTMAPGGSVVASPVFPAAPLLVVPLAIFAAWRGVEALGAVRRREFADHIWSPHRATMIIGIAFVVMLLSVGSWAYTEALAELAHGTTHNTAARLVLFCGLLGGAMLGGWTAGRLRPEFPSTLALARCLGGGTLMGLGSVMIPGSNDGLILIGLPLLQPHAFVALASMIVAITGGMWLEQRISSAGS